MEILAEYFEKKVIKLVIAAAKKKSSKMEKLNLKNFKEERQNTGSHTNTRYNL